MITDNYRKVLYTCDRVVLVAVELPLVGRIERHKDAVDLNLGHVKRTAARNND